MSEHPVATAEQHAHEKAALLLWEHPVVAEARETVGAEWLEKEQPSAVMRDCFDWAFEEVMFSAAIWSSNQDPGHPKVTCITRLEHQLDAHFQATVLQDVEQVLAPDATKAMASRAHAAALEEHLDVVPVIERVADQLPTRRIGLGQVLQRLVRQHHAPAKGVIGFVALGHDDPVGRVLQLHQQAKIQASWTATNA